MKAERISSRTKFPACCKEAKQRVLSDGALFDGRSKTSRRSETHELENPEDGVDVPSLVGSEPLSGESDLGRHSKLELVVGSLEEGEKLSDHDSDVGLVGKGVAKLESSSSNRDISVSKTVEDDGPVTLDGVGIHSDDLVEGVEGDVSGETEERKTKRAESWLRCEDSRSDCSTHRMLLSLFPKNFPRMLIAMTRSPLSASISRTARTVSYRIEFPTFFDESVFVAT